MAKPDAVFITACANDLGDVFLFGLDDKGQPLKWSEKEGEWVKMGAKQKNPPDASTRDTRYDKPVRTISIED